MSRKKKRKLKRFQEKCEHKNIEKHYHRRKYYPYGKRSRPRFGEVKRVTVHCKDCNLIVGEYYQRRD